MRFYDKISDENSAEKILFMQNMANIFREYSKANIRLAENGGA